MTLTLLILACFAGTENCRVLPVASGFANEQQCAVYSPLMIAGWIAQHPGIMVQRSICTTSPEVIIGAWMT